MRLDSRPSGQECWARKRWDTERKGEEEMPRAPTHGEKKRTGAEKSGENRLMTSQFPAALAGWQSFTFSLFRAAAAVAGRCKKQTRRRLRRVRFSNAALVATSVYFCHVRFLCRLALRRLRRLCFDIFSRRFFLRLPMV
jgi:hypothetical protein